MYMAFGGWVNPEILFPVIVVRLSGGIWTILLTITPLKCKVLTLD
ncbi:hypothetical protein [Candidatus Desulfovibrio trichonymphae]|nr:hypothetical protein [Candidatus Desulfovibrio trichonymphae]GHU99483.1 hypothetical protein AGMMS50248_07670 [Deltaproteobacteria bacterium]